MQSYAVGERVPVLLKPIGARELLSALAPAMSA